MEAAGNGRDDIVEVLVKAGADIDHKDLEVQYSNRRRRDSWRRRRKYSRGYKGGKP